MIELFLTFLKIGAVSFGGGYGMISLIKEEVISHNWLTQGELLNFIAVSESTPGPIAVNMATFIGTSQYGFLGGLVATLGVVLPAFIIILLIAIVLKNLLKYAGVNAFLTGVRPVVIGLIVATGISLLLKVVLSYQVIGDSISFDYKTLIVLAIITATYFIYKKIAKKNISPIILILESALSGIILYGFLGGVI